MRNKYFLFFSIVTSFTASLACATLIAPNPIIDPTTSPVQLPEPPTESAAVSVLPTLEDFDEVITFGGGGGGGVCTSYGEEPAIDGWIDVYLHSGTVCIWRADFGNSPFQVILTAPDGSMTLTANFRITGNALTWEGHEREKIDAHIVTKEETPIGLGIRFWWPTGMADGQWQILVKGKDYRLQGSISADDLDVPNVSLYDARASQEILPYPYWVRNGTNGLQVIGDDYPAYTNVNLHLYHELDPNSSSFQLELVFQTTALADASGAYKIDIPSHYTNDRPGRYVLVSYTDPNLQILNERQSLRGQDIETDYFYIPE